MLRGEEGGREREGNGRKGGKGNGGKGRGGEENGKGQGRTLVRLGPHQHFKQIDAYDRRYVFSRLRVEKERSAVAVVTGKVTSTCSRMDRFG